MNNKQRLKDKEEAATSSQTNPGTDKGSNYNNRLEQVESLDGAEGSCAAKQATASKEE